MSKCSRTGESPSIKLAPLLKAHVPYFESNHVLNLAYNVLTGGTCLTSTGCETTAVTRRVCRHFFGTKKVTITLTSTTTGTAHTFHRTDDIIKEIIVARIYGGMHYRTSVVHGSVIGRKGTHWIAEHYFQPSGQ